MDIVTLAGGLSPERDVSLASGCMIANALEEIGMRSVLVDLYTGAKTDSFEQEYARRGESPYAREGGGYAKTVTETAPDIEEVIRSHGGSREIAGANVFELCRRADAVFLALHGDVGENGQLQATLDIHGVKYTGSGYLGAALAMDKAVAKELFRQNGVTTPDWMTIRSKECATSVALEAFSCEAERRIGYPCVIKPSGCGSSVGVAIARTRGELIDAIGKAAVYGEVVMVESYVAGREFTVGVLGGETLPVVEIKPVAGFFDYKNKYQSEMTDEICPARIGTALEKRLRDDALAAHNALRLGDYSRIDFIVEDGGVRENGDNKGRVYCLEANAAPGMTRRSLFPQMASAAGLSYAKLCEKILRMAINR